MILQLRKLHLLIQHFTILQLRHTSFISQSLKEIHSGHETGLIDTGQVITLTRFEYGSVIKHFDFYAFSPNYDIFEVTIGGYLHLEVSFKSHF